MERADRVAVVTGSNKGIGLAIVKGLCVKFDGVVYLTSRNVERGEKAVKELNELDLTPNFHQLDIDDDASVNKFRDYLKETHGGIDLLVNNAAIAFKNNATEPISQQAEETLRTNYFGTLRVCNALFPILKKDARVVNISSSAGHLSRVPCAELRKILSDPALTVDKISELMTEFVALTKTGSHEEKWGKSTYVVSKVGLSALTRVHQRLFDEDPLKRNITINAVHPGYVDTDMTNHAGPLTVEEGAMAPLYLSLDSHKLRGGYLWFDCSVVDWLADNTPSQY